MRITRTSLEGRAKSLTVVMGFDFPDDIYYLPGRNSWVSVVENKTRIGITSFGQKVLGEVKRVDKSPLARRMVSGYPAVVIESATAIGFLFVPIACRTLVINPDVVQSPSLVNADPYRSGYIADVDPVSLDEDLANLKFGRDILPEASIQVESFGSRSTTGQSRGMIGRGCCGG